MQRHICFVSDQPVPSLTPLLDPALAVREVMLVHAPERTAHAGWLAAALRTEGLSVKYTRLSDGYDLSSLRREMQALADRHPQGVIANITGGTKPMALAAWEVFDRPGDRLYYVDIRHDSIRWLRPEGPGQPVADRIRLETYVIAHGLRIDPQQPAGRAPPQPDRVAAARRTAHTLARARARHISEGGQWLEELVFAEVLALGAQDGKLQDVARQIVIHNAAHDDDCIRNEIDVAILRDNTLHIVECKTGQAGRGRAAADAIYKLAQLVDRLGGLRGRGIFVSTETVSGPVKARAQQMRIAVIDRHALLDLRRALALTLAGASHG